MWGPDVERRFILVNGRRFQIRPNVWQFLHLARKLKISDSLWIDAICIDQKNTQERNHQVQQMADIYRDAKHVLIYPGHVPWYLEHFAKLIFRSPELIRNVDRSIKKSFQTGWNSLVYQALEHALLKVAELPYVLRPVENGYELVGEAFIHDIMDGSHVKKMESDGQNAVGITLV